MRCPRFEADALDGSKFCIECSTPLRPHSPLKYPPGHLAEKILTLRIYLRGAVEPGTWVNADDFEVVRVFQLLNGGFDANAPFAWSGTGRLACDVPRSHRGLAVGKIWVTGYGGPDVKASSANLYRTWLNVEFTIPRGYRRAEVSGTCTDE